MRVLLLCLPLLVGCASVSTFDHTEEEAPTVDPSVHPISQERLEATLDARLHCLTNCINDFADCHRYDCAGR